MTSCVSLIEQLFRLSVFNSRVCKRGRGSFLLQCSLCAEMMLPLNKQPSAWGDWGSFRHLQSLVPNN